MLGFKMGLGCIMEELRGNWALGDQKMRGGYVELTFTV